MSPGVFAGAELDTEIQKILGMGSTGVPTRETPRKPSFSDVMSENREMMIAQVL